MTPVINHVLFVSALLLACVLNQGCVTKKPKPISKTKLQRCLNLPTNKLMIDCVETLGSLPDNIGKDQVKIGCLMKDTTEGVNQCLSFFGIEL